MKNLDVTERAPLWTFISTLDRALGPREMHAATREAGFRTTLAAVKIARRKLGIAPPGSDVGAGKRPTADLDAAVVPHTPKYGDDNNYEQVGMDPLSTKVADRAGGCGQG